MANPKLYKVVTSGAYSSCMITDNAGRYITQCLEAARPGERLNIEVETYQSDLSEPIVSDPRFLYFAVPHDFSSPCTAYHITRYDRLAHMSTTVALVSANGPEEAIRLFFERYPDKV